MTARKDINSAKPVATEKVADRKQRQAEQLRANLQRRKEQMRQRDSAHKSAD